MGLDIPAGATKEHGSADVSKRLGWTPKSSGKPGSESKKQSKAETKKIPPVPETSDYLIRSFFGLNLDSVDYSGNSPTSKRPSFPLPTGCTTHPPSAPSTSTTPSLMIVPREIRNKILKYLFTDPKAPSFYTEPTGTRYEKFFAISQVNKQLNTEAKEELLRLRNLVILTVNVGPTLLDSLRDHKVPVISGNRSIAAKATRFAVARIHIKYPGSIANPAPNEVVDTAIILDSDLDNVAIVLRFQSLLYPHTRYV
jgi:hypothetical protein